MPFRTHHKNQLLLLPPDLNAMIPEKDLVRVIGGFVDTLPRRILEDRLERGRGRPAYHPRVMLKVLLYAYTEKLFSSRKIAKALRQNVYFMWLAGMERPDFNTVNRFRTYLGEVLEEVFSELAEFLLQQGYVQGKEYFVDGSLLEADARKFSAVWRKNVKRYSEAVRRRAREILAEVEAINREEDERYGEGDLEETGEGSELTSEEIEAAAREIGKKLEKRLEAKRPKARNKESKGSKVGKRAAKKLFQEAEKLRRYEQQEETLGGRNSFSKTDPDATFMRLKNGELRAGYNLQIGTERGFILGYSVSQSANDAGALKDHLKARDQLGLKQPPQRLIADAGYGTEENYEALEEREMEAYVKYPGWYRELQGKLRPFEKARFKYDPSADEFLCPEGRRLVRTEEREVVRKSGYRTQETVYTCLNCSGCAYRQECTRGTGNRTLRHLPRLAQYQKQARQRLACDEGVGLRKRRGWEVETKFAMLKKNLGYTRVRLRSWSKANLEIGYLAIGMNLVRLFNLQNQATAAG